MTIVLNKNVEVLDAETDSEGRYVLINFKYKNQTFTICNIYGPNIRTSAEKFYSNLMMRLTQFRTQNFFIMGGDFNQILEEKDGQSTSHLLAV